MKDSRLTPEHVGYVDSKIISQYVATGLKCGTFSLFENYHSLKRGCGRGTYHSWLERNINNGGWVSAKIIYGICWQISKHSMFDKVSEQQRVFVIAVVEHSSYESLIETINGNVDVLVDMGIIKKNIEYVSWEDGKPYKQVVDPIGSHRRISKYGDRMDCYYNGEYGPLGLIRRYSLTTGKIDSISLAAFGTVFITLFLHADGLIPLRFTSNICNGVRSVYNLLRKGN